MQVSKIVLIKSNYYKNILSQQHQENTNAQVNLTDYQDSEVQFGWSNPFSRFTKAIGDFRHMNSVTLSEEEVQNLVKNYLDARGDTINILVKDFKKIIKPMPATIKPDDFFHTTSIESANNIKTNGFDRTKRIQFKDQFHRINTIVKNVMGEIGNGTYFFLSSASANKWYGETILQVSVDLNKLCFVSFKDIRDYKANIIKDLVEYYKTHGKESIGLLESVTLMKELMPIIADKAGYKGIVTDGMSAGFFLPDSRQAVIFDDGIILETLSQTDKIFKKYL